MPWRDSWEYLAPLPVMDPGHRMELTRIIQLSTGGGPHLYLLGGLYSLSDSVGVYTPGVWDLEWNTPSLSYYWDDGLDPPMG